MFTVVEDGFPGAKFVVYVIKSPAVPTPTTAPGNAV
jgi:hypothetical protein